MASLYRLAFTASAEKELKRLPPTIIARIMSHVDGLAKNPRPPGCKKLVGGMKEWRIRTYTIDDKAAVIDITRIAHRREVYD